jgi:hypothetical protein
MDIIGEMHDFDFVAFIQRQPELVFAEQRFCFHCLVAFVADCLYGLHVCYGTLAVRATQVKPVRWSGGNCRRGRAPRLGDCDFYSADKPVACLCNVIGTYPLPDIVCLDTPLLIGYNLSHETIRSQSFGRQDRGASARRHHGSRGRGNRRQSSRERHHPPQRGRIETKSRRHSCRRDQVHRSNVAEGLASLTAVSLDRNPRVFVGHGLRHDKKGANSGRLLAPEVSPAAVKTQVHHSLGCSHQLTTRSDLGPKDSVTCPCLSIICEHLLPIIRSMTIVRNQSVLPDYCPCRPRHTI